MTNSALETLELRKLILQARSTLYRLRIQQEVQTLRDNFGWTRAGVSALGTIPVRSALLGIALQAVPHSRLARIVALAARMLLMAKVACFAASMLQRNASPPSAIRPGTVRAVIDI